MRGRAIVVGGLALAALALLSSSTTDRPSGGKGCARQQMDPRSAALTLFRAYLPCEIGSAAFAEIARDYGGKGTTCGFLFPWLAERLGDTDPAIVDRSDPEVGLVYTPAQQIKRMIDGAKARGAWRVYTGPSGPQPRQGDFVYYFRETASGGFDGGEHVNAFVQIEPDGSWTTADAGRGSGPEHQRAEFVTRKVINGGRALDFLGGPREIIGFVDLDALGLVGPFDVCFRPGSAGA